MTDTATYASDFSIASLSGSSEQLFPAAITGEIQERFVFNPSTTLPIAINIFDDPAVLNGVGSITLEAGQGWSGRVLNAINVIGSAGNPVTAGQR